MPFRTACLVLTLLALLVLPATTALAGAWPRKEGTHFLALTARRPMTGGALTTSVYHEFGLPEDRGLVLEADMVGRHLTRVFAFHQRTFGPADGAARLAFALGAGRIEGDPALAPRLMIGRGFTFAGRPGWATATLTGEWNIGTGARAAKLDVTLGLSAHDRVKTYVQLFSRLPGRGALSVRAEASAAVRLIGRTWLDLGMSRGLTGAADTRIKLGLWISF